MLMEDKVRPNFSAQLKAGWKKESEGTHAFFFSTIYADFPLFKKPYHSIFSLKTLSSHFSIARSGFFFVLSIVS